MKDYKFWVPILFTFVINVIGIAVIITKIDVVLERHLTDASVHVDRQKEFLLNQSEKNTIAFIDKYGMPTMTKEELNNIKSRQDVFEKTVKSVVIQTIDELKQKGVIK